MKDNEVIAGHLSPCVQIFIESLLNADLTTDVARDGGTTENSMDIKNGSRKAEQSEAKNPEIENMAKNISLILHRFKDVRTSILTLIFEDSPTFNNTGAQMYLGCHELSDLLEKLGKTHEEAAEILEKVIPTPSLYRLQLSLNDEQEKHARETFTKTQG